MTISELLYVLRHFVVHLSTGCIVEVLDLKGSLSGRAVRRHQVNIDVLLVEITDEAHDTEPREHRRINSPSPTSS